MMKDVPQAATLFDVICSRMFRWPVLLLTGCQAAMLPGPCGGKLFKDTRYHRHRSSLHPRVPWQS